MSLFVLLGKKEISRVQSKFKMLNNVHYDKICDSITVRYVLEDFILAVS